MGVCCSCLLRFSTVHKRTRKDENQEQHKKKKNQNQHEQKEEGFMNTCSGGSGGGSLELPLGFMFHPTDEEIIVYYLTPKALDSSFISIVMGEINLNKFESWELPEKAKMGDKEWYFYCQKDQKYQTGMRTNQATKSGYWKAIGKDKEICRTAAIPVHVPELVGMKKTLVFYKGRAPGGDKTNWVMHEYRLAGSDRVSFSTVSSGHDTDRKSSKDEWVVCRIFHTGSGIKKAPLLAANRMADHRSMGFSLTSQ